MKRIIFLTAIVLTGCHGGDLSMSEKLDRLVESSAHLGYTYCESGIARDEMISNMRERGISKKVTTN